MFFFIWLRGSLPRLRYDQFMAFGWKRLIPIALLWIVAVASIRSLSLSGGIDRQYLLIGIGILAVLFLVLFFIGETETEDEITPVEAPPVYPGGFPVPPMPQGGAVRGAAQPLTFGSGSTRGPVPGTAATSAGEEI